MKYFSRLPVAIPLGFLFLGMIFSFVLAQDEVGLYFDSAGTVNCLPDSTNFPFPIDAFLVLKNCSTTSAIGGWECAFSLPANIILGTSYLGPKSINVGQSPEFVVGLGIPIPSAPIILLARFSFLVMGPGEILLHAPEMNSIEGVLSPVYAQDGNSEGLIAMNYAYGDPFNPVATIGLTNCPADSIYQDPIIPSQPDWEILSPKEKVFADSGCSEITESGIPDDWDFFYLNWGVGLSGTIEDVAADCFVDGRKRIGAAKITISAQEVFWGPELQVFEIWFEGVDIPNCVEYDDYLGFSMLPDLTLGKDVVVFAGVREGVFWSSKWAVFPALANKAISGLSSTDYQDIRQLGRKHSVIAQIKKADLTLLLEPINRDYKKFTIKAVYTGDKGLLGNILKLDDRVMKKAVVKSDNSPRLLFGFFKKNLDGELVLLEGRKSLFLLTNRGWMSAVGYRLDLFRSFGKISK